VLALAALAGLGAGLLLSPDGRRVSTTTTTATRTVAEVRTTTTVVRRTVTKTAVNSRAAVNSRGSTSATHRSATGQAIAPPKPATASNQRFAGNGSRYLGNVNVAAAEIVRWSSTGTHFEVLFGNGFQAINSTGHSGQTFVPAGTYYKVRVQTDGKWVMRIG
jgi:hypothetical protein